MPELYLFTGAVLAIFLIVFRRHWALERLRKFEFQQKISSQVDALRLQEALAAPERFKDRFTRERREKKTDIGKFKEAMRKADMAIAKGQWKTAKQFLIQALALADDETDVSLKLANAYLQTDDLRKAEGIFTHLLGAAPSHPAVHENLAKIYVRKKRYKDAIAAYVKAVELNEQNDDAFVQLGKLYRLLMRPSLAAECFRRAAELKPRETDTLFLLADSCCEDEDFDNALFTYEKILTIEPYNEKAQSASQDVRIKMKEAETFLKTAA